MRIAVFLVALAFIAVVSCAELCVNSPNVCLKVRSSPSLSGTILACAPHKSKFTYDGTSRTGSGLTWRHVSYQGKWGWSASQYLVTCPSSGIDLSKYPTSYATSGYTYTGRKAQLLHYLKAKFTAKATTYASHSGGALASADLWTTGAVWNHDNRNMPGMNTLANYIAANLKPLGIRYVIWKQRIYQQSNPVWKAMENRGSITANHWDHVHITFA